MNQKFMKRILVVCAVSLLVACTSGVKRPEGVQQVQLSNTKVKEVQFGLTDNAKALMSGNTDFSATEMKSVIEKQLADDGLITNDSSQVLSVTISGFRTRSAFAAVMFGVMAGSDNIVGTVTVKDANGKVLKEAEINVAYALGGFSGGVTSTRMGWMYQEFAKHASAELSGTSSK